MKKAIALAGVVAVVTGLMAAAAHAKPPTVLEDVVEPYAASVNCGDFGGHAFTNLFAGTQRVRITRFYDAAGTPIREIWHIQFSETDTNSVTGKSLTLKGAVTEIYDLAGGTRTVNGKVYLGTAAGQGTYIHDTGRVVFAGAGNPIVVRGPHEGLYAGVDNLVCAALA